MKSVQHLTKLFYLFAALLWASCVVPEDVLKPEEIKPITILNITPDSARVGESIVITGENFLKDKKYNHVWFTPFIASPIDSATSTQLFLKVPDEALTGTVVVSNVVFSDTSNIAFKVLKSSSPNPESPVVTEFSPQSGYAGTVVTIAGNKFGDKKEDVRVYFGSLRAEVLQATETLLKVRAPFNATDARITINVKGKTVAADGVFKTVRRGHSISYIDPGEGIVGTEIRIRIRYAETDTSGIQVKFGNVPAVIKSYRAANIITGYYEIMTKVPYGAVSAPISVGFYGDEVRSGSNFIVNSVTEIAGFTSFTPKSGYPGDTVTIDGKGFGTDAEFIAVFFGDEKGKIISLTETSLKVIIPSKAQTGKITIQSVGGEAKSGEDFTVLEPPAMKITSIEPMTGYAGFTHIKIKGENFSKVDDTIIITFGNGSIEAAVNPKTKEVMVILPSNATTGLVCITSPRGKVTCMQDEFKVLKTTSKATISFGGFRAYHSWFRAEGTNGGGTSSSGSDTSIISAAPYAIKNCPDPYPGYVKTTFYNSNACYPGQGWSVPTGSLSDSIFHCLTRGGSDNRFIYDGIEITTDTINKIIKSLSIYHSEFITTGGGYNSMITFVCVKSYIAMTNVPYEMLNGKKHIRLNTIQMKNCNFKYAAFSGSDSHATQGSRYDRSGSEYQILPGFLPNAFFEMTLE